MYIPQIAYKADSDKLISIFWFRRDLRLKDNYGLCQALKQGNPVLAVFIFDTNILDDLTDVTDRRVNFIYNQLKILKQNLEAKGSSLLVCYGNPEEVYERLIDEYPIRAVYTNEDYEPYARDRDKAVKTLLKKKQIAFYSFKDHVIFEKDEILKDDSKPYTVFTPYMKKWRIELAQFALPAFDIDTYHANFLKLSPLPLISLAAMNFQEVNYDFPSLEFNLNLIENYHQTRDMPGIGGTSRLSVHIRFGTISIREAVRIAQKYNSTWLNELIWREFYIMIMWHFPHVVTAAFKPSYERIEWINNVDHFQAWCEGKTGYPIVDAGMNELNQTGYMHNRVRMITASFLIKNLLIDWRWGEAFFAKKLIDYELASNNGNWQWVAGCGCDAAPYFRIFNPMLQAKKFDPNLTYIKRWVPSFEISKYLKPIVEYENSRERALKAYKDSLNGNL
jgi:deoxyribodipyrimidine photo-lyase